MTTPLPDSLYDIVVNSLEGEAVPLSDYEGHVLYFVVVDVSGADSDDDDQLIDLQEIFEDYLMRGFFVLAIPAARAGGVDEHRIEEVLRDTYGVTFPVFCPQPIDGSASSELVSWLLRAADALYESDPSMSFTGPVRRSFEKFIVGPEGDLLGRFAGSTSPSSEAIIEVVEDNLPVD